MLMQFTLGIFSLSLFIVPSFLYARSIPTPIIFVHGFNGDAKNLKDKFDPLLTKELGLLNGGIIETSIMENNEVRLTSENFNEDGDYFFIQFKNRVSVIEDQTRQIRKVISGLRAKLRVRQFILVGYSTGGLAARAYLLNHRRDHSIKRLVTIVSPHTGTSFSVLHQLDDQYCKNENNGIVKKTICQYANDLIGFDINSPALKELLPDNTKNPSQLLGKMEIMAHPSDVEYASVIGQAPKVSNKKELLPKLVILMHEIIQNNNEIRLFNAFTSGYFDQLRQILATTQQSNENVENAGDGIVSLSSQDMSNLRWFKQRLELQAEIKNEREEFRAYKLGSSSHMEVFKINDYYHLKKLDDNSVAIIQRAITGPTMLKKAKIIDDYTIRVVMSGSLFLGKYFELRGMKNSNYEEKISLQENIVIYGKSYIELKSKKKLDMYEKLQVGYTHAAKNDTSKMKYEYVSVVNNSASSIVTLFVFILITLALVYFFIKNINGYKKEENDYSAYR